MQPKYYYQGSNTAGPKTFSPKILFILGGCVVAIIIASVLLFTGGESLGTELARAAGRQTELAAFSTDNQENIKDGNLARLTADAGLYIASDVNELTKLMNEAGISEVPKEFQVTDEAEVAKLEEALSQGRSDEVFQDLFVQKIDAQQALLREIVAKTSDSDTQDRLSGAYDHLEVVRKDLKEL